MIQGWLNPIANPEKLLNEYFATRQKKYLHCLVEQFNQPIFHYILSQTDTATAEDVVQQTWLKVMTSQSQHISLSAKAWLYAVARNTLIDELRRQNKWQLISLEQQEFVEPNNIDPESKLASASRLEQFNLAIKTLPFYQREAFIFKQEGFSVAEIGELTQSSFETVKSRLRYARKHLKTVLGNRHEA